MRTAALALFALTGCIDEFSGSELQIDFAHSTPAQASPYAAQAADELPANIHFTLYAYEGGMTSTGEPVGRTFVVQQFEIHHVVDLLSPCFIDVGEHVPVEGLHVSQFQNEIMAQNMFTDPTTPPAGATEEQKVLVATAVTRQETVRKMATAEGPRAITSASAESYESMATSCNDTNGIPPPTCTDEASNKRRLDRCQAAWKADASLFEGTDRVLTDPLNGTTFGFALGTNPANMAPLGGSAFFVDEVLEDFDGFAIFWQFDDANGDGQPDYPPSFPAGDRNEYGTLFMIGHPEKPTRGVIRAHMINYGDPNISAELAIFADIGRDDVHF